MVSKHVVKLDDHALAATSFIEGAEDMDWQLVVGILSFLGMGCAALASPIFVVGRFGLEPRSADGRNEVRAVYGGFGIAIAALLGVSAFSPYLRPGIVISVAAALVGMAAGRVFSFSIERPGKWPWIFFAIELALAGVLLTARR